MSRFDRVHAQLKYQEVLACFTPMHIQELLVGLGFSNNREHVKLGERDRVAVLREVRGR